MEYEEDMEGNAITIKQFKEQKIIQQKEAMDVAMPTLQEGIRTNIIETQK